MDAPDPNDVWTAVAGKAGTATRVETPAPTPLNYQSTALQPAGLFAQPRLVAIVLAWIYYINALLIPLYRFSRMRHTDMSPYDIPDWIRDALQFALIGLVCQIVAAATGVFDAKWSDTERVRSSDGYSPIARLFHQAARSAIVLAWGLYLTAALRPVSRSLYLLRWNAGAIHGNLIEHWIPDALLIALIGLACHLTAAFLRVMEQRYGGSEHQ